MPQLLAPSPAPTTLRDTALSSDACPAWCNTGSHPDDSPHFGGVVDIDLSLAEPGYMAPAVGRTPVTDFLSVALWQEAAQNSPVIGIALGLDDTGLPDMNLDEAEALARALLELVSRGRAVHS